MKVGDKVRAQFMTVPEEFSGKARGESCTRSALAW